VMIKPDNLERPSSLPGTPPPHRAPRYEREVSPSPAPPGHIIDLFGTTGLQLIGARVFCMRYHLVCGECGVCAVCAVSAVRAVSAADDTVGWAACGGEWSSTGFWRTCS
jgi:hypothetical protein